MVISTGTKNLQEQLFFKDIPFLEQHLGPLRVCYMKGRGNYACRQKIYDAEKEPVLEGLEEVADFQIIREWEKTTETGDRAEIKTLPNRARAWAKVDARSDLCTGQKCPQFERCFITLMHQRAQESDIIIVNHHLFFADLAVKGDETRRHYSRLLRRDLRRSARRRRRRRAVFRRLRFQLSVRGADARRVRAGASQEVRLAGARPHPDQRRRSRGAFFALFGATEGRTGFRSHEAFLMNNEEIYRDVLAALELIALQFELLKAAPEETIPLVHRAREIARRLEFLMEGRRPPLRLLDGAARPRTFLQATPIDVSTALDEKLFDASTPWC